MLTHITFKAGASPGSAGLTFPLTPVTVFVGPNNSGKSRALIEIEQWLTHPSPPSCHVIANLQFQPWEEGAFRTALERIVASPHPGEANIPDHVLIEQLRPQDNASVRFQLNRKNLVAEAVNPNGPHRSQYCNYLSLYTLRLDGRSRLSLIDEKPLGDLLRTPPNHLAKLFVDERARSQLRRIVHEAFGKYIVIDPTNVGQVRLRLSKRAPEDLREEQGWDERSRVFHSSAMPLSEASDGVKAFVGMLSTLVAAEPNVTLIDEPEAFLHPTLSSRLGKEIASVLTEKDERVFVATHSASFLMGCVLGGAQINIVRLTHDGDSSTARLLSQDRLIPLMRNPLLRSIGVFDALFYNAVVVTEADADRAFYQEINDRLLKVGDPRGIEGCLFLNAQNKQTVWDIVQPLRELGIPAAGIVDIDILKEGGVVWNKPMNGAFVPSISSNALSVERKALHSVFSNGGKDMKQGGVDLLHGPEREACINFFEKLEEYGIFVVPKGEVERWLDFLQISRTKGSWLATIFAAMGEDPASSDYVRPQPGDVWDFVGAVSRWVGNAARKGIPDQQS